MGSNKQDKVIEYTKCGLTYYRFAFTAKGIMGSVRIRKQGYTSYSDAVVAMNSIKTLIITGKYEEYEDKFNRKKRRLKFKTVAEEYKKKHLKRLKVNTRNLYTRALNKIIYPVIGDLEIEKVTTKVIQRFADTTIDKGYGGNSLSIYLCVLYSILGFAEKHSYIDRKPRWVTVDKAKKFTKLFITKSDAFKLIDLIPREDYKLFALVQYATGARVMEIAALTVADINTETNKINIDKTFAVGGVINSTKNGRSGVIPVSKALMEMIVEYIDKKDIKEGYIFRTRKGLTPLSRTGYNYVLKSAAERAGIKEHKAMSSHVFRRSRAVHLLEANCPLHLVAYLLRDEPATVVKEYIGVIDSVFQTEMKKYEIPESVFFGKAESTDDNNRLVANSKDPKSLKNSDKYFDLDDDIHL